MWSSTLTDKIGLMLPCSVVIQQLGSERVEVAAVDPVASMQAVENPALTQVAQQVQAKLVRVMARL